MLTSFTNTKDLSPCYEMTSSHLREDVVHINTQKWSPSYEMTSSHLREDVEHTNAKDLSPSCEATSPHLREDVEHREVPEILPSVQLRLQQNVTVTTTGVHESQARFVVVVVQHRPYDVGHRRETGPCGHEHDPAVLQQLNSLTLSITHSSNNLFSDHSGMENHMEQ